MQRVVACQNLSAPALATLHRVCIVNSAGNVLLDRYVRPKEKVTDFRTRVSGEARQWRLGCALGASLAGGRADRGWS